MRWRKDPAGQKEKAAGVLAAAGGAVPRTNPPSVYFEVLNEPFDKLTPELWNEYFAEALANDPPRPIRRAR
jgi:hypothetical protein